MRTTTLFILAAIMVAMPLGAAASSSSQTAMKDCNASWKALDPTTKAATTHNAYMSSCLKGGGSSVTGVVGGAATNAMNSTTNAVGHAGHAAKHAASSTMQGAGNALGGAANAVGGAVGGAMGAAGSAVSGGVASATNAMSGETKTASHSHSKIPVEGNTGTAARCKDGTTMQIHTHSGACSHHGGVAAWL